MLQSNDFIQFLDITKDSIKTESNIGGMNATAKSRTNKRHVLHWIQQNCYSSGTTDKKPYSKPIPPSLTSPCQCF